MKIDPENIPEEYLCVNCSPREVNRQAARTLQLQKRKEQSALLAYSLPSVYHEGGIPGSKQPGNTNLNKPLEKKNNLAKQRKNSISGSKKSKDGSGSGGGANGGSGSTKRNKRADSSSTRNNTKRKDMKRMSKKKLKQLEAAGMGGGNLNASGMIGVGGNGSGLPNAPPTDTKMASALRNWIDSYEVAMTNHYSPELRARLTALSKNPAFEHNDMAMSLLSDLVPSCTTVPHAGAKILISTRDIEPSLAVIEIRGKYMLANQHKPVQSIHHGKKPASGPFLFFYSLPKSGLELCVDTRTYANEARFVRRSCRPNAELMHGIEKNVIHLYIVAKTKIIENTEITIPHDQNVDPTTRTHSMSHTSTLCACGLVRDCKFAAALAATPPILGGNALTAPLFPPTGPGGGGGKNRKNGTHGPEKEKRKYKKRNKDGQGQATKEKPPKENRGRGRSTSSSCESNTGLMSPPLKNYDDYQRMLPPTHQQQQTMLPPDPIQEYQVSQMQDPQQTFYPNHHFRHNELQQQQQQQPLPPTYSHIDMILAQHMMSNKSPVKEIIEHHQPIQVAVQSAPLPSPTPSPKRAITPVKLSSASIPAPLIVQPPLVSPPMSASMVQQQQRTPTPPPPPHPTAVAAAPNVQIPQPPVITSSSSPPVTPQKEIQIQQLPPPIQQTSVIVQQTAAKVFETSPQVLQTNVNENAVVGNAPGAAAAAIIPKSPPLTPQKNNKRASKSQRNSICHDVVPSVMDESTSSVPTTPVPTPGKDDSEGKFFF